MKKLLKGLCALLLAASCVTSLPVMNVEAESITLDSEGWEIAAYQRDTNIGSEHPGSNEGPAENLLDNNSGTWWHNAYNSANVKNYSIVVDFNGEETFDQVKWTGRGGNGDCETYEIFAVNTTEDTVACENTTAWGTAITSGGADANGSFTAQLSTPITATHVKINFVSSDDWGSGVELDFLLDMTVSNDNWTVSTYFYDGVPNAATNEGATNNIIDDDGGSYWHSAYETNSGLPSNSYVESVSGFNQNSKVSFELEKPFYILVNFNKITTFNEYTFTGRNANENSVVTGISLYANNSNQDITISETAGNAITLDENWTFVDSTMLNPGENTIRLDQAYIARQVLVKITHAIPNYAGKLFAVCKNFAVDYKFPQNIAEDKTVTCGWNEHTSNDSMPSTATPNSTSVPARVTDGTVTDSNFVMVGNDVNSTHYSAYTQIDLGDVYSVDEMVMYRYWVGNNRNYADTVVIVSKDSTFDTYETIFNADEENFHGLGSGEDSDYIEESNGKTFKLAESKDFRYVRIYTRGWWDNVDKAAGTYKTNMSHIVEFKAFGVLASSNMVEDYTDVAWDKAPYESNTGFMLDSFYSSIINGTPSEKTAVFAADATYARYVSKAVGTVKVQGKKVGDEYDFRFVSSVASLSPSSAGFVVSIDGGNAKEAPCNTVFTSIQENDGTVITTVTPGEVFSNDASAYFTTFTLHGVPSTAGDSKITVTPYWVPYGSQERVYGVTRTISVAEVIAATPNMINNN